MSSRNDSASIFTVGSACLTKAKMNRAAKSMMANESTTTVMHHEHVLASSRPP